ncbi:monocarboxylate transporter 10 [Podospora australis]|uniref:Monocarboxylate transporter 10 n=1 Tax=Podospora australis TaxID=1536484 RepID=A0AAN6WW66_9PEZI|nr:monocarboxylate transporter 10 [Podospora australis]
MGADTPTAIELQPYNPAPSPQANQDVEDATGGGHEMPSLPPVDGGKQAWLFLAAAFMIEALVWGFPMSFGVFQNYYTTHPPFAGSSNIAVIGTCALGIMYLDTPLIMALNRTYPRIARYSTIVGLLLMCLALALSSFSTTVPQLIVTQGIFYAIGGSVAYSSCILYLEEWFVQKRGLAYGIMWSATGLAGVIIPLVLEYLLTAVGVKTTLRVFACAVFILTAPIAYYIKPRLPIPTVSAARKIDLGFVLGKPFLRYQLFNVVEAVGFFLPGIYLPSYARGVLGANPFPSVVTMLLVNVASVFGCVAMGSLIDRLEVTKCLLVSTAGATLGVFLLWGLSDNLAVLYAFSIVYGLFAGSYTSAWPGIMKEIVKWGTTTKNEGEGKSSGGGVVDPSMVFAFLALGRGVGNVISGPLSEALIKGEPWRGEAFGGYGSGYGSLIAFTGATAFVGGGSWVWKRLGWL